MTWLVDTGTRKGIEALVPLGIIDGEGLLPGGRDPWRGRVLADRETAHAARK